VQNFLKDYKRREMLNEQIETVHIYSLVSSPEGHILTPYAPPKKRCVPFRKQKIAEQGGRKC